MLRGGSECSALLSEEVVGVTVARGGANRRPSEMDTVVAPLIVGHFHRRGATVYPPLLDLLRAGAQAQTGVTVVTGPLLIFGHQEGGVPVQTGVDNMSMSQGGAMCVLCPTSRALTAATRETINSWC